MLLLLEWVLEDKYWLVVHLLGLVGMILDELIINLAVCIAIDAVKRHQWSCPRVTRLIPICIIR